MVNEDEEKNWKVGWVGDELSRWDKMKLDEEEEMTSNGKIRKKLGGNKSRTRRVWKQALAGGEYVFKKWCWLTISPKDVGCFSFRLEERKVEEERKGQRKGKRVGFHDLPMLKLEIWRKRCVVEEERVENEWEEEPYYIEKVKGWLWQVAIATERSNQPSPR